MSALRGRRVLLVEDDQDGRELMCEGLALYGAEVKSAESGEDALAVAGTWAPEILISDLNLPGLDGMSLLAQLRAMPGLGATPAIALTGHGGAEHREAAFKAGFAKHVLKPARLKDLVVAIQSLPIVGAEVPRDVRTILAEVNQASPCRFTSLLRFGDADSLHSVWTHDRENPGVDPFPLGMTVPASYCVLVRDANSTLVIEDAQTDSRTLAHPKRDELSTYIGVPVYRADGTMFGTVCSFDPRPLALSAGVRETTERASRELGTMLTTLTKP